MADSVTVNTEVDLMAHDGGTDPGTMRIIGLELKYNGTAKDGERVNTELVVIPLDIRIPNYLGRGEYGNSIPEPSFPMTLHTDKGDINFQGYV